MRYFYSNDWQTLAEEVEDNYGGYGYYYTDWFVYGNYIDEVLMQYRSNIYGISRDLLLRARPMYNPAALLDYSGAVERRYEYDAFGRREVLYPNYTHYSFSKGSYTGATTDVGFTGSPLEFFPYNWFALTEYDLLFSGHRWRILNHYPLARWLQEDPLGITPNPPTPTGFVINSMF